MRLIDADALVEKSWDADTRVGYVQVVDVGSIEEAPTLDVVPVVRCNECKHYETDTGFCHYWETGLHWGDFCSKGVKAK